MRFSVCKVSQKISPPVYLQPFSVQFIVFPVSFTQKLSSYTQSSTFFNSCTFLNFSFVVICSVFFVSNNFEFKFFRLVYTVILFTYFVPVVVKSSQLIIQFSKKFKHQFYLPNERIFLFNWDDFYFVSKLVLPGWICFYVGFLQKTLLNGFNRYIWRTRRITILIVFELFVQINFVWLLVFF